jgi:hypothetical protein
MTDTLGWYHFLPWARRGIGAAIGNADGGSLPARASVSVQLRLHVDGGSVTNPVLPSPVSVQVLGPGDAVGVDPRMVVRTEPRAFTMNFEPNYLCGIEFDSPDFPWLFTPASPNADRLRPWLTLLVMAEGEYATPAVVPNPLPVVVVQTKAALPDLAGSWNWAHVQISGDTPLDDALASAPGSVISRFVSPRRLDPETAYAAFLVPAFAIGVRAGMGLDVSTITSADPAWNDATETPLTLPYYYRFDFRTSDEGDFESLVRALTPRLLPGSIGQRLLDVSQPDPGVPSAGAPMGLPGALQSLETKPTPWDSGSKTAFQGALQSWINQTSATTYDPQHPGLDPVIVPPIYGRWHAGITAVDRTATRWIDDLNLDPRNRSAAGMGTQVVQNDCTQLMASAWQQVEGVRRANQLLVQAQLARAGSQQLYRQHLVAAPAEKVLTVTAPLHARLRASPTTIAAAIRASRLPVRMGSGAFRRIAQGKSASLVARVNSGEVAITPPFLPPGGLTAVESIASPLTVAAPSTSVPTAAAAPPGAPPAGGLIVTRITPQAIAKVPPQSAFAIVAPGKPLPGPGAGHADSAQAAAFRSAMSDWFAAFHELPPNADPGPALDVESLQRTILSRIDPAVTVPARVGALVSRGTHVGPLPPDPLEPIMAAPEFPQPMYAPLRDIDGRDLLPGVEGVLPDTIGVLEVNQQFIEGYMVGLNHEMARQLSWRGYPTDQRGSYFRQFWDVSGYVRKAGDPTDPAQLRERLYDIPPIHTWSLPSALGSHPNRADASPDNLVLLVRGELFKRYPNATVYAGKAKRAPDGTRVLDPTDERYPLFRGTLAPDMTFLGFDLTAGDARGGTVSSPDGFFFVFQEQPSEPRFGLEPTASIPVKHWSELAWTNFASGTQVVTLPPTRVSPWRQASRTFRTVLASADVPKFLAPELLPANTAIVSDADNPNDANNAWGVNSAQTAYILLRLPFRILIHADLMLPQP